MPPSTEMEGDNPARTFLVAIWCGEDSREETAFLGVFLRLRGSENSTIPDRKVVARKRKRSVSPSAPLHERLLNVVIFSFRSRSFGFENLGLF